VIPKEIHDKYFALLKGYLDEGTEKYLLEAADLARELLVADVPTEEIAELHEGALGRLADKNPAVEALETMRRTSAPLMEILMTYGLAFRQRLEQRKQAMEALEEARAKLDRYSKELEKKVEERTRELAKTNKELETFSKGLEKKVRERTFELSILYEFSNTISQALDYQKLMGMVMDSLYKIVDYDICASLIYDEHSAYLTFRPAYPQCSQFTEEVQNSLCEAMLLLTGEEVHKKRISTFVIPPNTDAKVQGMTAEHASPSNPDEERDFSRIRSFFNVPFTVGDETFGMLNVSSCRETTFSEEQQPILYTMGNQAANAIERLRRMMKTEKSKMESMVESMLEGVIMLDEQGEIVVLNPQAKKMLGFNDAQEVTGKDLYDKLRVFELDKEIEKYLADSEGAPISKELVLSQEEGSKTLHCEVIPIRESEDKVIGVSITLRDITREKEIEQMKNEFIASVSHELKTPLTIIKEATDLVVDEIPGKIVEGQRDILTTAQENIGRLSNMVNDLLDISKIESAKLKLYTKPANMSELIESTVSDFKYLAEEKGILLDYEVPQAKVDIFCDADKIRQVLVNLISNALKFTSQDGRIKVICNENGNEVIVSVQDTGIGISEENISRLFDRFIQVGRKPGAGEKGTGLGLAISKGIVELHQGRIWAESKVNSGSKFYFSLPKSSSKKPS